ncbi:MAG: fumarylacetoacetate hydrolase family protein [Alphaproteobacteria bacterium]
MDQSAAAAAAELLAQARRDKVTIQGLPDHLKPQNLEDAYQIQGILIPLIEQLSHGKSAGYKAGATSEAAQRNFGLEAPFRGVLVSSFMLEDGATIPAGDCNFRLLEAEFAFRMGEDLPSAAAPYDPGGIAAAVAGVMTSIEVVDLRFNDGVGAGGLQVIADNSAAGYWVAGTEIADLDAVDFEDWAVSLHFNGELAGEGNAANVLGNPFNALTWLANTLCAGGGGLKAGDIITAGACIGPLPAPSSGAVEVVADFGALGQVRVNFNG